MREKQVPTTRRHLPVKKGDRVEILAGDYRGATGTVKAVDRRRERVTVEGVNLITRHLRKTQKYPNGGTIRREAPIHVSNVRLVERG